MVGSPNRRHSSQSASDAHHSSHDHDARTQPHRRRIRIHQPALGRRENLPGITYISLMSSTLPLKTNSIFFLNNVNRKRDTL